MAFAVIFLIPFSYGAINYGMFNIRVIAKQAFLYSMAVAVIGAFIILLNYSSDLITETFPIFPSWVMSLISSALLVTVSVIIWRHLREGDILKYEFITTVTHKFRTPLTHIKWASENLRNSNLSPENIVQIGYIEQSNNKLVELTNLLVNASDTQGSVDEYKLENANLSSLLEELIISHKDQFAKKSLVMDKSIEPDIYTSFNPTRIQFALEVIVENAINYTMEGGSVSISLSRAGNDAIFSVTDSGIGIPAEEIPRIFSKFHRGEKAKLADTEGMGIGLYVAKNIVERHHGKIFVESAGLNKGSTFGFSLPLNKI
jgi:two-component system phosphate regulon sensor histidine kinase PhoR